MVYDNLEVQLYAISLSGILYGITVIAFFELATRIIRKRQKNLMDVQFLIFITIMFLLGTTAVAQGLFYLEYSGSIFLAGNSDSTVTVTAQELTGSGGLNYFTRLGVPISLPFTVLGSNGMMIWRLINLSRDTTLKARFIFLVVLFLVSVSSLGGAVEFLFQNRLVDNDTSESQVPIIPLAATIPNILLSTMVVLFLCRKSKTHPRRFEVSRNHLRSALSRRRTRIEERSPVVVILRVLGESYDLLTLLSVVHIVLSQSATSTNMACMVTLQMLPQVCVLSSIWAVEYIVKEEKQPDGPFPIAQSLQVGTDLGSVVRQGGSTSERRPRQYISPARSSSFVYNGEFQSIMSPIVSIGGEGGHRYLIGKAES